jgi:hypothetical protein
VVEQGQMAHMQQIKSANGINDHYLF